MENNFDDVMSKRTNQELIVIVSTDRSKYQQSAIISAEREIKKRNINKSIIDDAKITADEQKIKNAFFENLKATEQIRFLSVLIDVLVICLVVFIINYGASFLLSFFDSPLNDFADFSISIMVYFTYFIFMENKFQQTFGNMIAKTKVVDNNGSKPSLKAILKRNLSRPITIGRYATGFAFEGTPFLDRFSNTTIINIV
jgi:hypothetical protein